MVDVHGREEPAVGVREDGDRHARQRRIARVLQDERLDLSRVVARDAGLREAQVHAEGDAGGPHRGGRLQRAKVALEQGDEVGSIA